MLYVIAVDISDSWIHWTVKMGVLVWESRIGCVVICFRSALYLLWAILVWNGCPGLWVFDRFFFCGRRHTERYCRINWLWIQKGTLLRCWFLGEVQNLIENRFVVLMRCAGVMNLIVMSDLFSFGVYPRYWKISSMNLEPWVEFICHFLLSVNSQYMNKGMWITEIDRKFEVLFYSGVCFMHRVSELMNFTMGKG